MKFLPNLLALDFLYTVVYRTFWYNLKNLNVPKKAQCKPS